MACWCEDWSNYIVTVKSLIKRQNRCHLFCLYKRFDGNYIIWYILYIHRCPSFCTYWMRSHASYLPHHLVCATFMEKVNRIQYNASCARDITLFSSAHVLDVQAIIWTKSGILLIGLLGTNFSEILIEIHIFSFMKMSFGKWRPFCLGPNVFTHWDLNKTPPVCRPR